MSRTSWVTSSARCEAETCVARAYVFADRAPTSTCVRGSTLVVLVLLLGLTGSAAACAAACVCDAGFGLGSASGGRRYVTGIGCQSKARCAATQPSEPSGGTCLLVLSCISTVAALPWLTRHVLIDPRPW